MNYVEAHGTGTVLGDPIEFEALAATYGRGDGPCALGSVKTNLGHLEAAAGVAGFIKAVLAVAARAHSAQSALHPVESGHRCVVDPVLRSHRDHPVAAGPGPRRAAVSSFGLGGTNAHVVIEQAPDLVAGRRGRPGAGGVDVGGVGQDGAAGGVDGGGVGRLDGGRRGRRWRWPMWRTRSTITGPGTPSSPRCVARDRAAGGGRVAGAGRRAAAAGGGGSA